MVLLDKLWDDVFAGPNPDKGLGKLRKISTNPSSGEGRSKFFQRSMSIPIAAGGSSSSSPGTPTTPTTPSSMSRKENVWRSVFNPGSNLATKSIGGDIFDKPQPNSPTVYDWLYSGDTRSKHHR